MAIANGNASVSAISLSHNLAISGESRRYVVAFTRCPVLRVEAFGYFKRV